MTDRPIHPLPAAVLWDMDGTLVDTEPYWIAAEYAIVAEHGGQWSDELAHQLVGNPLLVSAEFILANSPVSLTRDELVDALLERVIARVAEQVPWRPGARELLDDLRSHDVPCALVTMSWTALARAVTDALPEGSFAVVVTGDRVTHGKPHPEPYLAAAAALDVPPDQCVAIEDSATGVRSAVAAGVPTIAVPNVVRVPRIPGAVRLTSLAGLGAHDLTALFDPTRA